MRGLRDRIAIVAGAAPGNIGGATAVRLAQEGMKVTAADLNEAAARAVVDQIKSAGGQAMARAFDITSEASFAELQNIGRDTAVMSVPLDVWRHTIDATLTGYMYGVRHTLPLMIEHGGGVIVNTTSSHGVRCNLVAPGFTLTEAAFKNTNEEYRNQMLASVRSPRLGAPEDSRRWWRSYSQMTPPTSMAKRFSLTAART